MGAFIGNGDFGVWATNAERDGLLDWMAEHRCSPGDPRWEEYTSDAYRWPGCGLDVEALFPDGGSMDLTAEEYDQVAEEWPHLAQLLGVVDVMTRGEWTVRVDSRAALAWRRPSSPC